MGQGGLNSIHNRHRIEDDGCGEVLIFGNEEKDAETGFVDDTRYPRRTERRTRRTREAKRGKYEEIGGEGCRDGGGRGAGVIDVEFQIQVACPERRRDECACPPRPSCGLCFFCMSVCVSGFFKK